MTVNELLNILYAIPYSKFTDGIVHCRVNSFTDIVYNLPRVDIDFLIETKCICFIKVLGDSTIQSIYPKENETNPTYNECFKALESIMTYLEIIGFKRCLPRIYLTC